MNTRLTQPRDGVVAAAGGVVSALVAIALYTRFSINGQLGRDEAIYVYSGQRMAHGTAPYASIFDPKTPLAEMVAALGVAIARVTGEYDIYVIRFGYFVISVLTVVAIYLLGRRLWNSTVAGVATAVVFAAFDGFANDALAGPDAKTPGVLCAVLSMWLVIRKQWFLGGLFGALAFLDWQPLGSYSIVAIIFAAIAAENGRGRAVLQAIVGSALPLIATALYFWAEGAFGDFFDAAFRFPLEGVERGPETVWQRLQRIAFVVHHYYHLSGVLFWIGSAAVAVLSLGSLVLGVVRSRSAWWRELGSPLVVVVFLTGLSQFGYAAHDFQGYPDVFPLLPYGALGAGGLVAVLLVVLRRLPTALPAQVATAVVLVFALGLTALQWHHFTHSDKNNRTLRSQRATACALNRIMLPHTVQWNLGDPTPLALTHRVSPSRWIYLGSGVDHWKIEHEKGGLHAWEQQIAHSHFSVLVIQSWFTPIRVRMGDWLRAHYKHRGYLGKWRVFLSHKAHAQIHRRGFELTPRPTQWPRTASGAVYRNRGC